MTDSQIAAQSITRLADKACWELASDRSVFPLTIQMGAKYYEVYVSLKPYNSDTLISILNSVPGSYRRGNRDVEMINADDSPFMKLTDECFIELGGTTGDLETQKKWLDQNPRLKVRIARECLGGVEIDSEFLSDDSPKSELLPLTLDCSQSKTAAIQEVWDPERKLKVKLRMVHTLRAETEADWRKWTRTGNEVFTKATKEWKSNVNWWLRADLYDAMALSIEGMTIQGQPCTAQNKDQWVKLVPTWHKFLVVTAVFDELKVKNG